MQLTREQMFKLPEASRRRIYVSRRVTAAISNARWSAMHYARLLLANGIVDERLTYRGRYGWRPNDRLEMAGGEVGIKATMKQRYKVPDALLPFATRLTVALVQGGVA